MKGFHVTLATGIFGDVRPGVELPRVFQGIRQSLVEKAKVSTFSQTSALSNRAVC